MLRQVIEESFIEPSDEEVHTSPYTFEEARVVFEKELIERIIALSFSAGTQSYFDQFLGYFQPHDIIGSGSVTQETFLNIMINKIVNII